MFTFSFDIFIFLLPFYGQYHDYYSIENYYQPKKKKKGYFTRQKNRETKIAEQTKTKRPEERKECVRSNYEKSAKKMYRLKTAQQNNQI